MPKTVNLDLYAGDTILVYNGEVVSAFVVEGADVDVGQWTAQIRIEDSLLGELTLTPDTGERMEVGIDAGLSQRLGDYKKVRWDLQQTFDDSTVVTYIAGVINMTLDVSRVDL